MVIGHGNRYRFHAAVKRHTVRAVLGQRCAIPLGFAYAKSVRARLGESDAAEAERGRLAVFCTRHSSHAVRQCDCTSRNRILRSLIRCRKGEPERFTIRHIAPGQRLATFDNRRCGSGVVRVAKRERSTLLLHAVLQVLHVENQHVVGVFLHLNLHRPNSRIVLHAVAHVCGACQRILYGNPLADGILYHLDDLVLECFAHIGGFVCGLRKRDVSTFRNRCHHTALGYAAKHALDGFRTCSLKKRVAILRERDHVEHALRKRVFARRIRVMLRAARVPLLHLRIVFVHERCHLNGWLLFQQLAVIVRKLRHGPRHRQQAIVVLVGHLYNNFVQRLRSAHTGVQLACFLRFPNLIGIRARMRVRDVAEVKSHRCVGRHTLRLRQLHARHAVHRAFGHRSFNGRVRAFQQERELIGSKPRTARKHLFTRKRGFAVKRTCGGVPVSEVGFSRFTSLDSTRCRDGLVHLIRRRGLREAGFRGFGHRVLGTSGQTVNIQGFAAL